MKNKSPIFKKILIANRGDVALRILRAAKAQKIPTVSIHSSADNDAMHVKLAEESVCIGPAKSWTSTQRKGKNSKITTINLMRFLHIVLNNLIWFLVLSAFVFFSSPSLLELSIFSFN